MIPRVTNPRTHTPEQVKQVATSIEEFGWTNPILVSSQWTGGRSASWVAV
jgi:ParB-like chromosome segregation protein Spo0J